MGFFEEVKTLYGPTATITMKKWIKNNLRLIRLRNHNRFLLRCKSSGFLPSHLINTNNHLFFKNFSTYKKFNNLNFNFKISILNLEITDVNQTINSLQSLLDCLTDTIYQFISDDNLIKHFFNIQNIYFDRYEKQIIKKSITKFNWLNNKYYNFKFNETINEKWIKNLTKKSIPEDVLYFLSLGEKYYINPNDKSKIIEETLTLVEDKIDLIPLGKRNDFRGRLSNGLQNYLHNNYNIFSNSIIRNIGMKTHNFLKQNKDIIVCKADKGNVTVILDKKEYDEKCLSLLNDSKVYQKLTSDPTQNIQKELNNKIQLLLIKKYINCPMSKYLHSYNSTAPKFYGLPKIHKEQYPMRPVTSFCGSPIYNLSKFISVPIQKVIGNTENHVKNSFEFVKLINNLRILPNCRLISLDVKALFTNIPKLLVLKCVKLRWREIRQHTKLPDSVFLEILEFCIDNAYCSFRNKFYKQIFGTPMGSPLSGIIADLVMEKLEYDVLKKLKFPYFFYRRYVDDIFIIVEENNINNLLESFNNYNKDIQFTIEIEENNSINFLDITIIRENDLIITNWHHKDTFSGRYVNFNSNMSDKDKVSIIYGLVDRAIKLSDVKFYVENLNFIYNILKEKDYPSSFLSKYINIRFQKLFSSMNTIKTPFDTSNIVILPFVNELKYFFNNLYKEYNVKIVFSYEKDPYKVFLKNKDVINFQYKNHVVYNIPCQCGACYIGETSNYIKDRINSHQKRL